MCQISKIVDVLLTPAGETIAVVARFAVAAPNALVHRALSSLVAVDRDLDDVLPAISVCRTRGLIATLLVDPRAVQLRGKLAMLR